MASSDDKKAVSAENVKAALSRNPVQLYAGAGLNPVTLPKPVSNYAYVEVDVNFTNAKNIDGVPLNLYTSLIIPGNTVGRIHMAGYKVTGSSQGIEATSVDVGSNTIQVILGSSYVSAGIYRVIGYYE